MRNCLEKLCVAMAYTMNLIQETIHRGMFMSASSVSSVVPQRAPSTNEPRVDWMKNMEKSLEFSQKQATFAPTFWIKNGRLAQLV